MGPRYKRRRLSGWDAAQGQSPVTLKDRLAHFLPFCSIQPSSNLAYAQIRRHVEVGSTAPPSNSNSATTSWCRQEVSRCTESATCCHDPGAAVNCCVYFPRHETTLDRHDSVALLWTQLFRSRSGCDSDRLLDLRQVHRPGCDLARRIACRLHCWGRTLSGLNR